MLVLTRKLEETIKIGNDIIIKVVQLGGGTVRLGIEAPQSVRILRGELVAHTVAMATPVESSVTGSNEADSMREVSTSGPLTNVSPLSANRFLHAVDAEYVASMEDQLLVSTAG
jgi:carbon storage regulator